MLSEKDGECDEYPGGGVRSTESLDSDDCGDSERFLINSRTNIVEVMAS